MNHPDNYVEKLEAETSLIFNDVTLAMIIIVLLFASVFATLVTSTKILENASNSVATDTVQEKPTEESSMSYFGEEGFPRGEKEKGFPTKDTFNQDLVITNNQTIRPGVMGNKSWNFEYLDGLREQIHMTIYIDKHGDVRFKNQITTFAKMQDEINRTARGNHVFVKLVIDETAPIKIYEKAREELWNDSDAIHWNFTTDSLDTILDESSASSNLNS